MIQNDSNHKTGEQEQKKLKSIAFIFKSALLYAALSALFSTIGLLPIFGQLLPKPYVIGNPLEVSSISLEHVVGHIIFGLIVGAATLKTKYFAIAGLFPIALDADHLVQFLDIPAIPRMAHSLAFGFISIPAMMVLLGRKDYVLGAVSIAAVLTHISFDTLLGGYSKFPFLIPAQGGMIAFQGYDWITFLLAAVAIVGTTTAFTKWRASKAA